MLTILIAIFIIGYLAIVFEHPLHLDKTVPAVIMAALMWAVVAVGFHQGIFDVISSHDSVYSMKSLLGDNLDAAAEKLYHKNEEGFVEILLHHLGKTAEILIFLIGAMTIVELIDLHKGFEVLKGWVKTRNKKSLLWIFGILAFILSAIIDNLTATIVLVTLLIKVFNMDMLNPNKNPAKRNTFLWFAGMIIVAANAGGAWSPIGDVTTTMLWIGNKVSALGLVKYLVIPSIICFVVPTLIAMNLKPFKGQLETDGDEEVDEEDEGELRSSRIMLFLGLGMIVFVPVFKVVTHLPPYIGMMLSMGIVWLASEYIHPEENFDKEERGHLYSAHKALSRIHMSSILFFLGILMAVAALESIVYHVATDGTAYHTLRYIAEWLNDAVPNQDIVVMLIGAASALIDNVPLVAASMGMYTVPTDDKLWHFIAYAAGTGGSMLVIGSAAGVAAMGIAKIDFIWYLKKIAWLALIGFVAGAFAFVALTAALGVEYSTVSVPH